MEEKDWEKLPTEERLHFYRCPACGKMVDNRLVEQIAEHHSHVLHPERFRRLAAQRQSSPQ
jgi:hypothetical protein